MSTVFTVSDILARGVTVEWHEGVSLVREVVQRLVARSEAAPSVPDLHQIQLSADGALQLLGGAPADDPVRRVGQLLQAFLAQSESPVQLRLLIAQATAPEPAFPTIYEYDKALEFFERPNRAAVLQALFARAAAMPLPADSKPVPSVEAIAPLPANEKSASKREKKNEKKSVSRTPQMAAAAAVLILASVAGVLYAGGDGDVPQPGAVSGTVSEVALKASDAIGGAVATGLSAVSERAGLGRLVFGAEAAGAAPAPVKPATEAPTPKPRRGTPLLLHGSAVIVHVFDVPSTATEDSPAEATPEDSVDDASGGHLPPAHDLHTYSAGSTGVSPPVGVRPQLPMEVPGDIDRSTLSRIELLITQEGKVDSVKLLGAPRTVVDSMLLSAAKTWEFQPAMKDGQPVRYRKIVLVAAP